MRRSAALTRGLDEFMLALSRATMTGDVIPVVLQHSSALLGATSARLVIGRPQASRRACRRPILGGGGDRDGRSPEIDLGVVRRDVRVENSLRQLDVPLEIVRRELGVEFLEPVHEAAAHIHLHLDLHGQGGLRIHPEPGGQVLDREKVLEVVHEPGEASRRSTSKPSASTSPTWDRPSFVYGIAVK